MVAEAATERAPRESSALLAEDDRSEINTSLVRQELDRVLSSEHFKSSVRICRFLRYVTEATLDGRAGELKETSIGVSVYDRDPSYDPKLDTVVRSDARRLRQKLDRYFEEHGQLDPVRISLPKGGYVPVFTTIATPLPPETKQPERPDAEQIGVIVAAVPSEEGGDTESDIPPQISRKRLPAIAVSAVLIAVLIIVAVLMWRHIRRLESWNTASTITPLTSFPGESYQPSISPDGKLTAFIWNNGARNFNVYVMQAGGKPLRITSSPDSDLHPVWSPDGTALAFLRASATETRLMLIPFPGGQEKILLTLKSGRPWGEDQLGARSDTGPAWTPDGKGLLISDTSPSGRGLGIYEFDLATQQLHSLTDPAADERDLSPVASPDGRWIAFARFSSYDSADIYAISRFDHQTRQLTAEHRDIQGLAWQNDSRSLIFSSNRDGAYDLWTTNLDHARPTAISTTGESAIQPAVSRDGSLLVYADSTLQSNIVKIDLKHPAAPVPTRIAASTRRSHSAQFSPDGTRIVFISDRSGKWELWVANSDGSDAYQLTHFEAATVGSPRWSPDGKWIAFDARPNGRSAIYVIAADGHGLRSVSPEDAEEKQPAWSPDGKWIYLNSNRSGTMQLWKVSADGGIALSVFLTPLTDIRYAPGGAFFFTKTGEGLWQMPAGGGDPVLVRGLEHSRFGRLWTVTERGIYFVDLAADRSKLKFYDLQSHATHDVLTLPVEALVGYPSLSYSPADDAILLSEKQEARSDLVALRVKR